MEFTLLLTICLVVMVIFLFLRNLSATLIPGCAVPFSIVGTFAVMYLLGYSLNNLSLMALTLSVGFVVDDAIVMLENIVRHMEMGEIAHGGRAATASREIGFTILSMTISLVAVFIPVLFMGGIVGRLLHEFSVTIVVAILISGFVSLTLTPMLGSRFLKHDHQARHGIAYRALEGGFNRLQRWYERHSRRRHALPPGHAGVAVLMLVGTVYLFTHHAHRLHPQPGQRLHVRRHAWARRTSRSIGWPRTTTRPARSSARASRTSQTSACSSSGGNQAFIFANMKPREERTHSVDQIIEQLRPKLAAVPGLLVVHAESAAHHGQRPEFAPAPTSSPCRASNLKEIYDWAPQLDRQDARSCPASWTSTPTCRSPARR